MLNESLFNQVMDHGLRDWFAGQAFARAQAKETKNTRAALTIAACILLFTGGYLYTNEIVLALGLSVGLFLLGITWAGSATTGLTSDLKTGANFQIADLLGLSYQQKTDAGSDFRLATQLGLLPGNPDEETHTDAWFGQLSGLDLHLHESHLQEWVQRGKSRSLETVFHGVVLGYQFTRPFSGTTIVRRDLGIFNAFGALGAKLGNSLERVRLVDPQFEKAFEVFGSDQVEARYLVHPAFCERLLDMERTFEGKNLRMAFAQGRVVIAIETGDLFETGGMDADEDEERVAKTLDQIGSLLTLSQTLNERARSA